MKGIRNARHIAVFTIFVILLSMFSGVSADTTLALTGPVITPDFDSNEYVFDISVSGDLQGLNASLILASYDETGTAIDKVISSLESSSMKMRLPSGNGEKSYKIMLVDSSNLKPLCSAVEGELGWNYKTVTIISDDIANFSLTSTGYELEYYVSPSNTTTEFINIAANTKIEYNKELSSWSLDDIIVYHDDVILNFVDAGNDGTYDIVQAFSYYYDRIENITDSSFLFYSGNVMEINPAETVLADIHGNKLNLSGFEIENPVAVLYNISENKLKKLVKLSSISGMIETKFEMNGIEYVSIEGAEYPIDSNLGLALGDEGIFYIGMTGKIVDFDALEEDINYAYVLEFHSGNSAFEDILEVKLLTEDGIKIYSVSDKFMKEIEPYFFDNDLAFTVESEASLFCYATNSQKTNSSRLISYKLNDTGEIDHIELASYRNAIVLDSAVYNAGTNQIGGYNVSEDAVVFDLSSGEANDTSAYDIGLLSKNYLYSGAFVYDMNDERKFVIIIGKEAYFIEDNCMAIVTRITSSMDSNGEEVTRISYISNGLDETVTFNDDSLKKGTIDYRELNVGDVFMFISDDMGNVTDYTVVAQICDSNTGFTNVAEGSLLGDNIEIKTGYIANSKKQTFSKGELITLGTGEYTCDSSGRYYSGGEDILIPNTCNSYYYIVSGRKTEIDYGPFTPEYAYVDVDAQTALVVPILLILEDNNVKETYFFWTPHEIPVSIQ